MFSELKLMHLLNIFLRVLNLFLFREALKEKKTKTKYTPKIESEMMMFFMVWYIYIWI